MCKAVKLLIKAIEPGLTKEFLFIVVNDLCAPLGAFCSHLYIKKNNEAQVLCFSFYFKGPKLSSGGKPRATRSQQQDERPDCLHRRKAHAAWAGEGRGQRLRRAEEGTGRTGARKPRREVSAESTAGTPGSLPDRANAQPGSERRGGGGAVRAVPGSDRRGVRGDAGTAGL